MSAPFEPGRITWMLGIEDTCVYPADPRRAALDEHALTDHTTHWREDLALARDLGATAVRYGVSWPLVHVAPGEFDWTHLDAVLPYAVGELGLVVVADLVHYGTPPWLADSFADPGYPDAIEAFAAAFATRYRDLVQHFTPLNEPVTTASFCGLRGVWPPARTGWDGWVSVAVPIAVGMVRTMSAIRGVQPGASIVHVEAATDVTESDPQHAQHAALLRAVGWLPTDLMLGRVDAQHPMHAWLIEHGADPRDLEWLVANGAEPDLIGVNYYPDLTPRQLLLVEDAVAQLSHDRGSEGLAQALIAFGERYSLPLLVTETSIEGDDARRLEWLRESARAVHALAAGGLDLRGYTWWPLFDFVDWSWAAGGRNVEEFVVARDGGAVVGPAPSLGDPADGREAFLRRMGLVRLVEDPDGILQRVATPAADAFRQTAEGEGTA